MFIFPIRSDRRLHHLPWMNCTLIAANVAVFLITQRNENLAAPYVLDPVNPRVWQFLTYQFLHANAWHIIGNMVFLYVFGNSVEDRLGKIGYLAFYLSGGVLAGLGHCLLSSPVQDANGVLIIPTVVGASGSIAAVTGAYLALFPLSNVTLFYWFFFIGTFEISSIYLILFQVAENLVMELLGGGGVAYLAHLAGYASGFAVGMGLLFSRLLPREPFDLLAMLDRIRRRRQFAALTRQGFQPWEARAVGVPAGAGQPPAAPPTAAETRLLEARARVSAALSGGDLPGAVGAYMQLLEMDPGQVMGQRQQLDLANQFMAEGKHEWAARAYELFLNAYPTYAEREQIQLILGIIYGRYLNRRQRAVELLKAALPRLHDPGQKDLAEQTLAQVRG